MQVIDFTGRANPNDRKDWGQEYFEERYRTGAARHSSLVQYGYYRFMGWEYRPKLNTYVYKQWGQWHEAYAPNKTLLRKNVMGTIVKIVKV